MWAGTGKLGITQHENEWKNTGGWRLLLLQRRASLGGWRLLLLLRLINRASIQQI
jgi:hypothetical protein